MDRVVKRATLDMRSRDILLPREYRRIWVQAFETYIFPLSRSLNLTSCCFSTRLHRKELIRFVSRGSPVRIVNIGTVTLRQLRSFASSSNLSFHLLSNINRTDGNFSYIEILYFIIDVAIRCRTFPPFER